MGLLAWMALLLPGSAIFSAPSTLPASAPPTLLTLPGMLYGGGMCNRFWLLLLLLLPAFWYKLLLCA
jgi:hypothetical protein